MESHFLKYGSSKESFCMKNVCKKSKLILEQYGSHKYSVMRCKDQISTYIHPPTKRKSQWT